MRLLIAHNQYQRAGGEDSVVREELALMRKRGHTVEFLSFDNDHIHGTIHKAVAAAQTFFSITAYRRALYLLRKFGAQLVHVHNFFPTMSPAIFYAARRAGVPVVVTLHNYRLICANGMLFREMNICEECPSQHSSLPGIWHGCYRGSRVGSAIVGAMTATHSKLGTWTRQVDRYIALTSFAAGRMKYRVPAELIRIKSNFVPDRPVGNGNGNFTLFIGRLSPEKGIDTLIEADQRGLLPLPLHIFGEGPMLSQLQAAAARPGSQLRLLGFVSRSQLAEQMRAAKALVVPSIWYEGFPMVVVEALATGLPVLASRIGSLAEIVSEGQTGALHEPGDPVSLANKLSELLQNRDTLQNIRTTARQVFESKYSEEACYERLMEIYGELVPTSEH